GVYVASVDAGNDRNDITVDARNGRALFIVRSARERHKLLYNVPLFTYHAYNTAETMQPAEQTCLYDGAKRVTLHRPGGGVGGHVFDEHTTDVYDAATPRQTFAHWDAKAIGWLERQGYEADYCSDLDLHRYPEILEGRRLLLAFGHHEYWTDAMRNALEEFLDGGGNAAFFTGNTSWFRIGYDPVTRAISRLGRWVARPEEATFGLSYRYGGGKWIGDRPPTPYAVIEPEHPFFRGCGFDESSTFGDDECLAGYECDGIPPAGTDAQLLASASLAHWAVADGSGELNEGASAGVALVHRRGRLFAGGAVDWPRAIAQGRVTARIARNVVSTLSSTRFPMEERTLW
ncbi:MAG: N,N-dimethylformamidase beta subunit family domain-containing protein, partial [Vulcanimicrobiaceae bacterium]